MNETVLGHAGACEYVYDEADRLYQVLADGEVIKEYTYDDSGSRLSAIRYGETVFGSYDDQQRVRSHGDLSFVWTVDGVLERGWLYQDALNGDVETLFAYVGCWLSPGGPDGMPRRHVAPFF